MQQIGGLFLTDPHYFIASPIKPCQKMPMKIKFIKVDDEGILPYCEKEDAEKFYFQQILTARFSWWSNITHFLLLAEWLTTKVYRKSPNCISGTFVYIGVWGEG